MMDNAHPDELELLVHLDERDRTGRARAVADHVAECEACARAVRDLRAARTALRAAPRLELPAARRAAVSSALAKHPRRRRSHLSPRRVAALLAPVAVLAVVVVAVDAVREDDGDVAGGDAATPVELRPAEEGAGAGETAAPEADEGAGAEASALTAPVANVAGPPADVLRLLRAEGLTARLSGGRVVVSDASADQVLDALRRRRRGGVPVVLE